MNLCKAVRQSFYHRRDGDHHHGDVFCYPLKYINVYLLGIKNYVYLRKLGNICK